MRGRPRHSGPGIPPDLNRLQLNLRAFCELPPRGETLEAEVRALVARIAKGQVGQTEGTEALLRIVGRELDLFAVSVKEALPHGYALRRE